VTEAVGLPTGGLDLFVLPLPEEAAGLLSLPEPPVLRHAAAGRGSRARIKQRFWPGLLKAERFRPKFGIDSKILDLVAPERLAAYTEWGGLYREPTMAEQPLETDEALDQCTPQFILRNLERYEKDAWPDELWWDRKTLRDAPYDLGMTDIREMRLLQPIQFHEDWNMDALGACKRERTELFEETPWSSLHFRGGRKVIPKVKPAAEPQEP